MKVSAENDERTIVLTGEQMRHVLSDFYCCVAKAVGYEETEDTIYDYTRILVAPDVQDAIIYAYRTKWPDAPMNAIIIRLAISGPKVRHSLHCGEVVIQKGFISMQNES